MEQYTNISAILGSVLPFLISFIKRFIKMDEATTYLFVFLCCLVVSMGLELSKNDWKVESLLINFSVVLASSQVVFGSVMKNLGWDDKIEDGLESKVLEIESPSIKAIK